MESSLDEINSWAAYKTLINNEKKKEPVEYASTRNETGEEGEKGVKTVYRKDIGKKALYNSSTLPGGETTSKKLHWMRPHPALLLQTVAAMDESSSMSIPKVSIPASDLVNVYARHSQSKGRKRSRGDEDASNKCNEEFPCHVVLPTEKLDSKHDGRNLFCPPQVTVDLTKLFDPVLHSEWLPGLNTSIHYGNSAGLVSDKGDGGSDNSCISQDSLAKLKKAFNEFITNLSIKQDHACNEHDNQMHDLGIRKDLMNLSTRQWMELLPSFEFMNLLSDEKNECLLIEDPVYCCHVISKLMFSCPSKSFAEHLLSVVLPTVFIRFGEEIQNPVEQREEVKEMAIIMIRMCGLGKLTKSELIEMTKDIPQNYFGTELHMSIAQEFYDFNEQSHIL